MSGLLEKDICLLLKGHRNTMILFLMICVYSSDLARRTPLFWAIFRF